MRSTTLIAAVSLGLALAGCGKKNDSTSTADANMSSDMNASMNSGDMTGNSANMASTGTAMPAQQFVDTIAGSDMFEIQSGKLAETAGGTAAVKAFGKQLVTDHTKSSTMLKQAAASTKPVVALPMVLPADLKTKLDALKGAKGADFDKLFIQQQTEGHQQALNALQSYAAGGDQPSLQDFATKAVPVVQGHLTKLQSMGQ